MKWILRILYILFVLIIWGFIELIAGGTQGIRVSEYIYSNITEHAKADPNYDILDALGHLNAVSNTYYSKDKIPTLNNELSYDNQSTEEKYKVKVGMYPHAVVHQTPNFNLYNDGFFIVFEDFSSEVAYYSVEVTGYYAQDPNKEQIILKYDAENQDNPNNELNVFTDIESSNNTRGSFRVALITNGMFGNQIVHNNKANKDFEFPTDYTFEYNIQSIDIFAFFANPDDPAKPESAHIYRITDGTDFAAGEPKYKDFTLNLAPETYNFSKFLDDTPPTEDNNPYNFELSYHPADLSPYNFVYWIVYSIYVVIFLIAPYFLFVHKHVMKAIRKRKGNDSNDDTPKRPPMQQLFSDIEPKSDK